jgi:hypothetical protein
MWGRDSVVSGILLGIIFPLVGYGILWLFFYALLYGGVLPEEYIHSMRAGRTIMVLAICCNIIPLQVFKRRRQDNSIRGIAFPTILFVIVWFIVYGSQLFQSI